jgi:hypothetical protein
MAGVTVGIGVALAGSIAIAPAAVAITTIHPIALDRFMASLPIPQHYG